MRSLIIVRWLLGVLGVRRVLRVWGVGWLLLQWKESAYCDIRKAEKGHKQTEDEPVAVDSDWRSEVDSNVYSDAAGCCILSAMAAGLETAAVDSGSRLVFLVAAKVVADVAAARSLRCMEAADRAVLVDGTESSVNRRSIHSLPSLYMKPLYCRIGVGE